MWTDELQERAVAKRQPRLQEAVESAAQQYVEPPPTSQASTELARIPQADLGTPDYQMDWEAGRERREKIKRDLVAEWQREHEELRLHRHRQLGRVSAKGLTEMEQRLEHGEPMVDEKGNIIGYRPIRTRDLESIIATAIDKQLAIEKRILGEDEAALTVVPSSVTSLLERLELLAQQNPIKGKVPGEYREPKVIDVEAGD